MKYIWGVLLGMIALWGSSYAAGEYATLEDFLTTYVDHFDDDIPQSYEYIQLYFKNVGTDSELYPVLQRAVYLDMIANKHIHLDGSLLITENSLAQVKRAHRGQQVQGSTDYVTQSQLQNFVDNLPDYRAYYCSLDTTPTYTIDVGDFSLTDAENFAIMDDVYQRLTTQYLYRDQLTDADLIAGAIKGMVSTAGDEYTTYFLPAENELFQTAMGGEYAGVGIVVEPAEEGLRVMSPFQGSPAKEAGIEPDDLITHVDGTDIAGRGADATELIIGPVGTDVTLTILRDGRSFDITITRALIQIEMLTDELLDNGDYYISLTSFGYGVSGDMKAALQRYIDSGASDLIIDLRHNPGGSVGELEAMLNMILPAGTPAFQMQGEGYDYAYVTKTSNLELPSSADITILIDNGSASASEMLALILQDQGRATIVGETSFGKGTAQSLIDYVDGSSFKYTIYERSSSRSGTSINGRGVQPDYTILLDESRLEEGYDNQLEYAKRL